LTETESQEQQLLEEKLRTALEEAWAKTKAALEEVVKGDEGDAKTVWLAAEAAEYSSLLYSLTYGLEDVDPPVRETKGRDAADLVKESVEAMNLIRAGEQTDQREAYGMLRNASHSLRTVYLASLKKREGSR